MFEFVSKSVSVAAGLIVAASSLAIVAVAPTAHATSTNTSTCVDGNVRANLSVTWKASDSISFKTKDGKKLCNDVTVFFSSYTMPDNYDGKGFTNNPTATPQQIFDSKSFVMKKGTDGASSLKVKLPEACKNIQVDLYYAPEIKVVTSKGHGAQYISGKIYTKTADECEPKTPPVEEPEAQEPPTPAPEVEIPQTPEQLPVTGAGLATPLAISGLVGVASYAASRLVNKKRQ